VRIFSNINSFCNWRCNWLEKTRNNWCLH